MTTFQKTVKYIAMALAIFLSISIISGILDVLAIFTRVYESDAVTDEITKYSVASEITDLKVNIKAADFTIKRGDTFTVESYLKNLKISEKNGTLGLKEKKKASVLYNGAVLTLYVPESVKFNKAEITTGAGKFTVDGISTKNLMLSLGAGDVELNSLNSTSFADIDGGAGRITIKNSSFSDLDLDMGVGQLNFTASVFGDGKFNLGVGEANLSFIGNEEDYSTDIDKGIGNISVNNRNITEYETHGGKLGNIEIDGGVGTVNVNFK